MTKQKTTGFPSNILFVDCETKGIVNRKEPEKSQHYLWFGYACACEYRQGKKTRFKEIFFDKIHHFWKFVESRMQPGKPLYIFAHNITFDLTVLDVWGLSERNDWEVEFAVIDDPPVIVKFNINGIKMILIDTFNYFKCSVADLGKSVGLSKLEMPRMNAPFSKWQTYCKRDVEVIERATLKMFDWFIKDELGGFAYTIAGLALNTYKRKFLDHKIFIHDNPKALKLERDSYLGGLVECYFLGEVKRKKLHVVDVNSMYPFVMMNDYPTKLVKVKNGGTITEIKKWLKTHAVIAQVTINSKQNTYPIKHDGRLIYANGNFDTTLVGPELEKAINAVEVSNVQHFAVYEKEKIFQKYVSYFWKERIKSELEGDFVKRLFCKYLLNSLYGKFGQQLNTWQPLTLETLFYLYHAYGKEYPDDYKESLPEIKFRGVQSQWYPINFDFPIPIRKISTQTQIRVPRGEHNESFPGIAAYVTAYGRTYLSKLRSIAGKTEVYYCDTDSLVCSDKGRINLDEAGYISKTDLGSLKVEATVNYACFFGLKDYIVGNVIKTKGIRKDAIQIGENEFMQNQFEGLKSILKREREPYVTISWVRKQLSRDYHKGIRTNSGWVTPITL